MATVAIPRRAAARVNEGISAALLLALLLACLTGSVAAVGWVDGLGMLVWPALGGMVLGILIAKLPVRARVAYPFAIGSAFVASVAAPYILLIEPLGRRERLVFILTHLRDWTWKVLGGGTASDNLVFIMQLVFFAWLFGMIAAWLIFRSHRVWGAISLIGGALLLNLFYAPPQGNIYLILFMIGALLLVVRMNLHALEQRWQSAAIGYSSEINFDFFQYGILFSLLLLSVVWALPETVPGTLGLFDPFQETWSNIEDQVARAFGGVKPIDRRAPPSIPGSALGIGGPIRLSDRAILDIQSARGRYWRSAVYDRYTGGGWISSHNDTLSLNASDPRIGVLPDTLRTWVTQTVQLRTTDPNNTLYTAGQPVRFDLPIEVRYNKPISDKGDFGFDLTYARARRNLRDGDTYTIVSALSDADEDTLRAVPTNYAYPSWFTTDYLQLPDRVTPRVQALAKSLTQNQATEYDKVVAIEKYVRAKIKYNESVAAPPSGRDSVDYMLFERPEGYCNYYASAMAILARLAGIPARVASGYSLDESQGGVYHVQDKDSHAWVEIYFPGYGWIEFEPTASKPEITRPKKPGTEQDISPLDQSSDSRHREPLLPDDPVDFPTGNFNFDVPFWTDPGNLVIVGLLIALVASVIAGGVFWRRNETQMAQLEPAARIYERMLTRARWLGVDDETTRAATPLENARALSGHIPDASADTERIAAYYSRERFGAWKPKMTDRAALEIAWVRVRAAWRAALFARATARVRSLPGAVQSYLQKILKRPPPPGE